MIARKKPELVPAYYKVQHWPILFGDEELIVKESKGSKITNARILQDIQYRLLQRNRDAKYVYGKLLSITPENLFPDPSYYILRYQFPGSPFITTVDLGDNVRINKL
jgi:hypothetical protein